MNAVKRRYEKKVKLADGRLHVYLFEIIERNLGYLRTENPDGTINTNGRVRYSTPSVASPNAIINAPFSALNDLLNNKLGDIEA